MFIVSVLLFSVLFIASIGYTGRTPKSGTSGCSCHTKNTAVTVAIVGPDTLQPGKTGSYTVTVTGGPTAGCAVDVAASSGTLAVGSGETYLSLKSSELTINKLKPQTSGTSTFSFTYTAPATAGAMTLYATGLSSNGGNNTSGDGWNFAPNKTVVVATPSGIKDSRSELSFSLAQNYPNPFNPATKISYTLPQAGQVSLVVYDISGKEVNRLVNTVQSAGSHSVEFNAMNIPSGIYFYALRTPGNSIVKKMTLLK